MNTIKLAGLAALAALSACGSGTEPTADANASYVVAKSKPLSERDPVAYKNNVESAMQEIPQAMRPDFQKLLTCTIKKEAAAKQSTPLTAQKVRDLTAQLKADPTAATTACQS